MSSDQSAPGIHALDTVSLREGWPDKARHFTPWLADHLDLLSAELALDLEQAQVEATLPGAGGHHRPAGRYR